MKYQIVLPSIVQEWTDKCYESMGDDLRMNTLVVDNTQTNRFFPRSVNLGIQEMRRWDSDWLIICSAAIRFGDPGGQDFIEHIASRPDHFCVEATPVFGWHLIAFSRRVIETCGWWDENWVPYGWDDIDYSHRIAVSFDLSEPYWEKVPVDLTDAGMAHSVHIAGIQSNADILLRYLESKWGSRGPIFPWTHPFNDPNNAVGYWPAVGTGSWDMKEVQDR